MSIIPPMTPIENSNIDWNKVRALANDWYRIDLPVLQVVVDIGGQLHRIIVDGNHRICARQQRALPTFAAYEVPPELEEQYRIRAYVDGREVPIPY